MSYQVVNFQFPSGFTLTATLTPIGGGDVVATASSVDVSNFNLGDASQWYGAKFPDSLIGPYQLNVYKLGVLVLTTEVALCGPLANAPIVPNAAYNDGDAFDRVWIDHLFHGQTHVWWRMEPAFTDPGPYIFALQASYCGHADAVDWVDITLPAANVAALTYENKREQRGKMLLTHIRVILVTARARYVSKGYPIWGNLPEKDYKLANEIARKESLRLSRISTPGYLLRKFRYGNRNLSTTDMLTGEIVDNTKSSTWGTAFDIGYHPPTPLALDMTLGPINESRGEGDINTNNSNPRSVKARFLSQPDVVFEDVWVHAHTDERYLIKPVQDVASVRGVPIVREVVMAMLPRDHIVYKIPVSPFSYELPASNPENISQIGNGCIPVNHDYDSEDALAYMSSDCCGVAGATVKIFLAADYNAGNTDSLYVVAETRTVFGGQWAHTVNLNPDDYVVVFEKFGEYGPDALQFTVTPPPTVTPATPTTTFTSTFDF